MPRPGNPKGRSNNDEYVVIAQRHLLPNGGPNERSSCPQNRALGRPRHRTTDGGTAHTSVTSVPSGRLPATIPRENSEIKRGGPGAHAYLAMMWPYFASVASWMLSSSRGFFAAAAAPTQQRRPRTRMMPVCDSAWTGAAPRAPRCAARAARSGLGVTILVLANARAHWPRVAAWAARYVAQARANLRVTKILCLLYRGGAKRWRGKCCRTGRDSPWLVYCTFAL